MDNEQKKTVIDLVILMGLPFIVIFFVYPAVINWSKNMDFGISSFMILAVLQFFSLGFAAILLMLIRRESFAHFGVVKKDSFNSIMLTSLVYVPHTIIVETIKKNFMYIPFQYVIKPQYLGDLGSLKWIIVYFLTMIFIEFFEVFTYIVINDKINKIFKTKNLFLDPGAILCAVFVDLIYILASGIPFGWVDIITTFVLVYGMLIIKKFIKNSVGAIVWFTLCWNTII